MGAEYGEVFTRRWVVELMLNLAGYTADRDLVNERVVEPSVGSGAFVGPLIERLLTSRRQHHPGQEWGELRDCLRGWDLQVEHIETCSKLATKLLTDSGCPQDTAEELAGTWFTAGDFLLAGHDDFTATLVVGNPPYIRIEELPSELLRDYRAACPAMGGRADIFVGFIEHGLDMLEPEGRLAFICADRWMHNSYGKALRGKVLDSFAMDVVLSMHDAPAFEAEVSAYPAITVIRSGQQGEVIDADATEHFEEVAAAVFCRWVASGTSRFKDNTVDASRLSGWHDTADLWPVGSAEVLAWLADLHERFEPIERADGLTQIRIGIATGNDKVYCPKVAPDVEQERLLPIAMNDDVKSGGFCWGGTYLVNPWEPKPGGVVDLERYPRLSAYFEQHREALSGRNVAGRGAWYQTIDRVHEERCEVPYLVMEDMKGYAHPVVVPPGYYPHHNLYGIWSTGWDLDVLGGLLMSEAVERQVAAWCVKMRGGTLRFQAQYLRKVRLPAPETVPVDVATELAEAFRMRDRAGASKAALKAFGLKSLPQ